VRLVDLRTSSGATVRCRVASTFTSRFLGLMGRSGLAARSGVVFVPGGSVHTWFMRFPIDVVFIDPEGSVKGVAERVRPWRLRFAPRGTRYVLELPAGEAAEVGLLEGGRLEPDDADGWTGLRRRSHESRRPSPPLTVAAGILAVLVLVLSVRRFDTTAERVEAAIFGCTLVLLAAIDLEHHVLPNRIVVPASVVLATIELATDPHTGVRRLLWAAGAFGVALLLALVYPAGLGMGDVKLSFLLGLGLGRSVLAAFLLAFLAAGVVALFLLVRHGRAARRMPMPLGPFLALGSLIVLFTHGT
jgi:leader peptidase (prepilin peptidase)/N-methyltransferase